MFQHGIMLLIVIMAKNNHLLSAVEGGVEILIHYVPRKTKLILSLRVLARPLADGFAPVG